jgi:hypothetical protein
MAENLQYRRQKQAVMKAMAIGLLIMGMVSCTNNNTRTASDATGTQETIKDTNHLITDSVEVPDTNTADIDPMKKRN